MAITAYQPPRTAAAVYGTSPAPLPPPGSPAPLPPPGAPAPLPPPTTPTKKTGYAPPGSPGWTVDSPAPLPPPTTPGSPAPLPPPTSPPPPAGGILSTPGAYEEWIKTHVGDLNSPTRLEGLYDSGATSALDRSALSDVNPGDSSAAYKAWLAQNGSGPDATSSKSVLSSLPTGPSKASDVYSTAKGTLSSPGAVEDVYGQHGDAFDSAGAREDWYAKYGSDPMQKSYTETLYEGGIGQLDPAYQYAMDRALEKARTSSAARSQFNSTYAGREERDVIDNLAGQQASKWVDLAPVADEARRARYDQGEKFAGDSNSDYRQRLLDTFDIAGQNDKATNDRLSTLSGIASAGDASDTARDSLRVGAAKNADSSAVDVYRSALDANKTGADLSREQGDQDITRATALDASNRANLNTKASLATSADSSGLNRFSTQAGLEKDLQTFGENRINGGLDATTAQADREAKLTQQIYSDTANIDSMDDTQLQALADKYGVSLQELNSVKDDAKAAVGLLTAAVKGK